MKILPDRGEYFANMQGGFFMGLFGNNCGDGNGTWIWILIIVVLVICCSGDGLFGGGNNC